MDLNESSIIDNIKLKEFEFCDMKDVKKFMNMARTEQSNNLTTLIKGYIRVVGENIIYYYNENKKTLGFC